MRTSTILGRALSLAALALPNLVRADEEAILPLSSDESFHFEILISLAQATYGGADAAPVLGAAKDIKAGDFESFSEVFHKLAKDTKAAAQDDSDGYDAINARDSWFAAATYFRRADFYLHSNWSNPLINELWEEQTSAFNKALAALPIPGKRVQIQADEFKVEAIWYTPDAPGKKATKRPTLILGNGYDGSQEDLYHTVVIPALARGWNCLTYEGPGHPTVRRKQGQGFIPDWERVVTPVVDYLYKSKSDVVDKDNLVLFGFSFGGYLAARAAAYESRLSAVILDGGVWDVYEAFSANLTPELKALYESGKKEEFDEAGMQLLNSPQAPSTARWGLGQGLWSFKTHSPFDFFTLCKKYAVESFIKKIKVPVLILDASIEGFFAGQSQKVKDALGSKATLHVFPGAYGYHCQAGAYQELNRVMFGWLNKNILKKKSTKY